MASYLVVGLGNPGASYASTRHNIGFVVADAFAEASGLSARSRKFSGLFGSGPAFGHSIGLLKPQTFMNLSGDSVQPAAGFLKVVPASLVVVYDELDLPFGTVRFKMGGGHAGHNGVRSVIDRMGTPDFVRLRVGIGRPPPTFRGEIADYVLAPFSADERARVPEIVGEAVDALGGFFRDGLTAVMNRTNAAKK